MHHGSDADTNLALPNTIPECDGGIFICETPSTAAALETPPCLINTDGEETSGLAPNKVKKHHVSQLISLTAERSSELVKKPKFKVGHRVRIAKQDLPFKKGYKQNFTDELFRVTKIATFNAPTYYLADSDGEDIAGKFYEPEMVEAR